MLGGESWHLSQPTYQAMPSLWLCTNLNGFRNRFKINSGLRARGLIDVTKICACVSLRAMFLWLDWQVLIFSLGSELTEDSFYRLWHSLDN